MAGLKGPDRKELDQLKPPADGAAPVSGAGEVMDATGGSKPLPGVSPDG